MSQLIVYAHPLKNGHCGEVLKVVLEKLPTADIIDLYEDGFNPVMSAEERRTMTSPAPSAKIKAYQKKITAADDIIFIYPVWWNSTPAILQGFFDRVFTYGFAFEYDKRGMPVKLFSGKRGYVIATSGAPDVVRKFMMGDMALKVVAKTVLGFCGVKGRALGIGGASKLDDKKRREIKSKCERFLQKIK